MLFQEPGSQLLAQSSGALFPLGEGYEVLLFGGVEEKVEGSLGLLQPLLPQSLAESFRHRGCWLHRGAQG